MKSIRGFRISLNFYVFRNYFNKDAYMVHCREYREYKDWEKHRNPERYKENQEKAFDRKNVMHCVRLLHMGYEIAKTGKVNVDRTNIDREFLLDIRTGNTKRLLHISKVRKTNLKKPFRIRLLYESMPTDSWLTRY